MSRWPLNIRLFPPPDPRRRPTALNRPGDTSCSSLSRPWDLDNAVLIVAELAANAAQHGRADLTVLLTRWRDAVHITVQDTGAPSNRDEPTTGRDEVERGRGLAIVSALADWTRTGKSPTTPAPALMECCCDCPTRP
ncbi:ATP-binding protein [Streptomyces sp. RTd22]|uniref:ATP-binding protein n=1 Tax=Streptomyces sp. RTd22 TaxID=1841249 RepID=UPI003B63719D